MSYISLEKESSTEFTERKSVFIGSARPVKTEAEALGFIASVRKKYADATHNVYAYVLRDNNISRFSDDGEPHGTAGLPVLDVLRKEGITDAVIVVTRYFGGILLGAGGLVRAYTASAKAAVDKAGRAEWRPFAVFTVECDYSYHQKLSYYYKKNDVTVENAEYGSSVTCRLTAASEKLDAVFADVSALTNGKAAAKYVGEEYRPVKKP